MELFRTDFYQLSMCLAYFMLDMHNDQVVFEGFCRSINPKVNLDGTHYRFDGEDEIREFIQEIKNELRDINNVINLFSKIVLPKVHISLRNTYHEKLKHLARFSGINTRFIVNIYPNGGVLKPYVPFFQYVGPRWIGQLIETRICLLSNSKTGLTTNHDPRAYDIVYPSRGGLDEFNSYAESLSRKAKAIQIFT